MNDSNSTPQDIDNNQKKTDENQPHKKRRLDSMKAKSQQRRRRRDGLFNKAYEYAVECDADVYVILRVRKNGQIFTFNSDSSELWPPPENELDKYYPIPKRVYPEDLAAKRVEAEPERSQEQISTHSVDQNGASSEIKGIRDNDTHSEDSLGLDIPK